MTENSGLILIEIVVLDTMVRISGYDAIIARIEHRIIDTALQTKGEY